MLLLTGGVSAQTPSELERSALENRQVRSLLLRSDGPLRRITREDLFKLIEIREGEPFSSSASRLTIQRLHATRIFHDIQILAEPVESGQVDVEILLVRRYDVRAVRFEGRTRVPQRQLRRAPTLRPGRVYEPSQLEESLARLQSLYQRHGFFRASIQPEFELHQEQAELDVRFRVEPGPQAAVGELQLELEGPVDRQQVLELIQSQPGKPYSETQQETDLERVKSYLAVRGFLDASVSLRGGARYRQPDNLVDLAFRVVTREMTAIRITGLDWPPEKLAELPLFREGSLAEIFLEESRDIILEDRQKRGFFLARVDYQLDPDGESGSASIQVEQGQKQKLVAIEFEGNRFASTTALRGLLTVREAGFFGNGQFTAQLANQDRDRIRSHYQQNGFLDVAVDYRVAAVSPAQIRVIFQIAEGERYHVAEVSLLGPEQIPEELVRAEVQTREGAPFSPLRVARDRAAITALYENRGFRQVELRSELQRLSDHRVSVHYVLREGEPSFLDEVVVTGRRRTREPVIRREITLSKGGPFSLDDVLETEANLYGLAVFNRVQVHDAPSFKEQQTRLALVQVEEAKKYTLLYGIGYGSFEGPRGTFGITDNNFLGQARSLTLGTRLGARRQRGSVTYTIPHFLRWRLPTVFSLSADNEQAQTRRTIGGTRAIRGRPFDSFTLSGAIQSEKRLSRRESLFFRYQFERVELDVPLNLEQPLEFFREERRLRLSSLGLSYLNDSRDAPSDPRAGFFLSGDLSVAGRFLGSEEQLGRIFLQGQYYRPVQTARVWVASLRLGLIGPFGRSEQVPISQRFFTGGASTLRGLPQDLAGPLLRDDDGNVVLVDENGNQDPNGRPVPEGGNALLIFNTEFRFPIWSRLRGALFYDVGNVFRELGDFSVSELSHAIGFGFQLSTPIGPLRFDIGYNPDPPAVPGFRHFNFHVTLGHPF